MSDDLFERMQQIEDLHRKINENIRLFAATRWKLPTKAAPVCDCGALKARTTHADWCSTCAA